MPDILKRICTAKRGEIERLLADRRRVRELERLARDQSPPRGFHAAIEASERISLIAEVKKGSPSKGILRAWFDPAAVAAAYEAGGARCISVLTDEPFFRGSLDHLGLVRERVALPLMRKDFLLDPVQLLEARAYGADCVLLIVAALSDADLRVLLPRAGKLGMDALVEVHDEEELRRALNAGAKMIGVNNRSLRTFDVDLAVTRRLAPLIPKGVTIVAESGINSRADIESLKPCGIAAVLVGECLMRAGDIEAATHSLSEV